MRVELMKWVSLDEHVGCFGEFNIKDPICRKLCALNLRCAIENEKNTRLEIIDELVSNETLYIKIQ